MHCTMFRGYTYKPGTKLMLELVHGEKYAGHVRDCEEEQITIIRVYDYETQTEGKSNYPLNFFRIEIRNITVLEEVQEPPSDEPLPTYYQKHHEILDIMIRNFIYIVDKDNSFNHAIKHINSCTVISIAALVPHFGKGLYLTLLGVGTPEQVFLFDLKLMGPTAFENGLKEILQSNGILKVVHSAKNLSESLFYQHNVSLRHIFDTEVADMTVSFRANSSVRPKARCLKECMWHYFDVPQHVTSCFYIIFIRVHSRPLGEVFKMSMATQAVYLLDLKKHLEAVMVSGYEEVRNYFLNSRRHGTLADSWKNNTLKLLTRQQVLKPNPLENFKPLSTAAKTELNNVEQPETGEAASVDEQVTTMNQLLTQMAIADDDSEYELDESSSDTDYDL